VLWLLRGSVALNALLGLAFARRLRRRALIRAGRIGAPERDFAALADEAFVPVEPGCVALVGDSQVALAPWLELFTRYRNRGLPGAKIADVAAWIDGVLADDPAHLVLMIGSNDVYFGVPRAESLAAARDLLDRIAARRSCPVTVVSVPPLAIDRHAARTLNEALAKLVTERGFRWLDIVPTLSAMDWTGDGLHLNAAAYRAVAPVLLAALKAPVE
jgi:lysophospholipase L1-like esterase